MSEIYLKYVDMTVTGYPHPKWPTIQIERWNSYDGPEYNWTVTNRNGLSQSGKEHSLRRALKAARCSIKKLDDISLVTL